MEFEDIGKDLKAWIVREAMLDARKRCRMLTNGLKNTRRCLVRRRLSPVYEVGLAFRTDYNK